VAVIEQHKEWIDYEFLCLSFVGAILRFRSEIEVFQ
jgi:hypothetical protein